MTVALLIAFGTPLGLLLALAALPLVVLFLLKRRHRDHEVASTLLWSTFMEDALARSPFRRPTEWLSLLLLLLAVTAAALAAAGTRFGRAREGGEAVVAVVDVTASMATQRDGESRFDVAKAGVAALLRGLGNDDVASVVVAASEPRLLGHRTSDFAALTVATDALLVEPASGDLAAALTLAVAEAVAARGDGASSRIVVYSDFAVDLEALQRVDTRGIPTALLSCGEAPPNAGITHAAVTPVEDGGRLLVTIAGRGDAGKRTVTLTVDDALVDARECELVDGRETSVVFDVTPPAAGAAARYRVALDPEDALTLDDELYVGVHRADPPVVLHVGDADPFVARLPRTFPGLILMECGADEVDDAVAQASAPFDLTIFTETPATVVPAIRELYLGCVPSDLDVGLGVTGASPVVVDWDRSDVLLRNVGFDDLLVVQGRELIVPDDAAVLVRSSLGALLARCQQADRDVFVWGCGMRESNFALTPAFPLFVRNLLGPSLGGVSASIRTTGRALRVAAGGGVLKGMVQASLTSPSGVTRRESLWSREEIFWEGPVEVGFYTLRAQVEGAPEESAVARAVGVNLLSLAETVRTASSPDTAAFESGVTAMPVGEFQTERPVWRELVMLAVVLLIVEATVWARPRWRRRTGRVVT